MIERQSCYFCTSPFQLFAIIALANERKEEADLYIDPQFSGAETFARRVEEEHIFKAVKVIDSNAIYNKYIKVGSGGSGGLVNHLYIALSYCRVKQIAEMILLPEVRYRNMFVSSKAYLPRMVQLYYIKKKWDCDISFFDDGAGTYYENRAYRISKYDKIIRTILFGKKSVEITKRRYVFSPEVYSTLNPGNQMDVKYIKKYWETDSGKATMNRIFGVYEDLHIDERLIILDQPKDELFTKDQIDEINTIYYTCAEKVGVHNAVIKKHPRSTDEDLKGIPCFKEQGVPFEMYCMNLDLSNKIIVCYSSTAAVTPKILFNQEPVIIVLCKLVDPMTGEKNMFEDFFCAVKKTYTEPGKVYIPGNKTELEKILASIQYAGGNN